MKNMNEKRLKLWKARQEAEGYDVSEVKTLEDAENFFHKQQNTPATGTDVSVTPSDLDVSVTPSGTEESMDAQQAHEEEVIEDEQCDIDPPGQLV